MKYRKRLFTYMIYTSMTAILILSCQNKESILGHWRCDRSGLITSIYQGETEVRPVTELYDAFEVNPFEFEFLNDGTMIQYNWKTKDGYQEKVYTYFQNYLGDPNKIIIRSDDGKDDNIMTIKKITQHSIEINLHMEKDEAVYDLVMDRLNE